MFKLKIDTRNAAFEPYAVEEVVRILDEVKAKLLKGNDTAMIASKRILRCGNLFDINGNMVGNYTLTKR